MTYREDTRDAIVERLDAYAATGAFPNLRGSMARVRGSTYYRPPPRGCPTDEPTTGTLLWWLDQARLESRVARSQGGAA